MTYDDAGNITVDSKFRNLQFQYDANNRQKQSANSDGSGAVVSVYDAGGQRVATQVGGALTNILVYDASGKLLAEYGSSAPTGGTQYLFSDHQGSPRAITSGSGAMISRHDYAPFGEEIGAVGMRTSGQGYSAGDNARQKYAGMESDDGSGMATTLWRKYDSSSGRWTSPDPYGGSMSVASPQSFNRYSYVNNDPVNKVDPTGLMLMQSGEESGDVSGMQSGGDDGPPGDPFETGRSITAEAEARYDRGVADTLKANGLNDAIGNGNLTREQAEEEIKGNNNLAIDDGSGDESVTVSAEITSVAQPAGPEHQQTQSQHASQEGTLVPHSESSTYNCMAYGLGHEERWMRPGADGHSVETIWPDGTSTFVRTTRPVTPGNLPGFVGGRWIHANQTCPTGTYKTKIYEDSANSGNWHVQRKAYGSRTWTSKNGSSFRFTNIRNPDVFYRQQYHPAGTVIITAWCVPVGAP